MTVTVNEIKIGQRYRISGDIQNGYINGQPYICHEEVTRRITGVTDTHVICECGRRFLINNNLNISLPNFRNDSTTNL